MSKAPLVLAIEPDLRQAAIVKRVVRERVLADVVVVDSRDAAIDAIRSAIPDVLLVSALLTPRDEDDLVAHLRTLEGAAHLQTHTIPQLASALGPGENGGGGLFSAFRRKKPAAAAPAGCDPDLFADEIRVFLQNAAEKKRQAAESGTVTPLPIARRVSEEQAPVVEQPAEPAAGSVMGVTVRVASDGRQTDGAAAGRGNAGATRAGDRGCTVRPGALRPGAFEFPSPSSSPRLSPRSWMRSSPRWRSSRNRSRSRHLRLRSSRRLRRW